MDGGVTIAGRGVNKIENNNSNKFFFGFPILKLKLIMRIYQSMNVF